MRSRPLPPTTFADAVSRWRAALQAAGAAIPLRGEVVPLRYAAGRLPTSVLRTIHPCPSYAAAAMDGYALRAARTRTASQQSPVRLLIDEEVFPVDTGAALPPDCDAVVPLENAHIDGMAVTFHAAADTGEHVRLPGEDIPPGVIVGGLGRPLDGLACAALIACGAVETEVVRRPRVTIIPTGEELQEPGCAPASGRVFDSNSTMVAQAARELGAVVTIAAIVKDDRESLRAALRSAATNSDAIFVLGGSSRGGRDVSHDALRAEGSVDVRGVATRPGKPVNLGHIGGVAVVNLPGYPVASFVAFHLYGAPLLRRLGGRDDGATRLGTLGGELEARGDADEWHAAQLVEENGRRFALPPGSAVLEGLHSLVCADVLVHVPKGRTHLAPGAAVRLTALRQEASGDERLALPLYVGPYDALVEELAALLRFRCCWIANATLGAALATPGCSIAGWFAEDRETLNAEVGRLNGVRSQVLGQRLEGVAVKSAASAENVVLPPDGNPWSGAAAVSAGLIPAAHCSAYVARAFRLNLTRARARWFAVAWRAEPGTCAPWPQGLREALRQLAPSAKGLGWEHIEVSEK